MDIPPRKGRQIRKRIANEIHQLPIHGLRLWLGHIGLKPRRGDTHAVQLTPYKRSAVWWKHKRSAVWWKHRRSAVWCWRCARAVGISERCDRQRRISESVDSRISPICRHRRVRLSPHYALPRLYGVNCACRHVSCLRHVSRFEKYFLMVRASQTKLTIDRHRRPVPYNRVH